MGHTVVVANNGQEGIEAFEEVSFDVVLMDIEMPGMDGFETTRAIRKKEDDTGHRVPIIAITAHAVKGFRERCFEAGMDDYLTKPLKREQLFESMNALDEASRGLPAQEPITVQQADNIAEETEIPPTAEVNPVSIVPATTTATPVPVLEPAPAVSPSQAPTGVAAPVTTKPASIINRDELHTNLDGSIELLEELFEDYESRCPELLDDIRQHIAAGNAEGLQFSSHTLKGVVAIFGAEASRDTAKRLEDMAREDEMAQATELFEQLEREIELLSPEIRKVVEEGW
jgi:CheY-like chemotaxis protein